MAVTPVPPTPELPFWRDGSGQRTTLASVSAAGPATQQAALMADHVEAVTRILRAAADARLANQTARSRSLAAHASRLCGEVAGLWPSGSERPLR